ncbi:MAG TPA: hypothetical protein VHD81_10825 [Mycobacteriales bacterium]|nr:hypothetical protein [Mycobacteriales bacterium]
MATFTSQPYQAADAKEFLDYMQRMMGEVARLQKEGRIPDDTGTNTLLDFWRAMVTRVRADSGMVSAASTKPITTSWEMTESEYQRTWAHYDTILSLLEILDLRGAVKLEASPAVMRVITALYKGTLAAEA